MVKKNIPPKASPAGHPSGLFDSALAGTVQESAQQIWLAGLGAFSKAQEEGGRVFEALVQEGVTLQRRTQTVAEERLGALSARVKARVAEVGHQVGEASAQASGQWDRLESLFEERVAKALARLGVPHANEVRELTAQVARLSAQVADLTDRLTPPARKTPVRRATTRDEAKPATKARTSRP